MPPETKMLKIKICTWNVNSINARLPVFLDFLRQTQPDILLLQELKCIDEKFPAMEVEDLGYNLALFGQKTYNGVAILSKFPIDDVTRGLPNFPDENSRYIEAVINLPSPVNGHSAIRVASVYVPNGQEVGSDKFEYKMRFFDALQQHLQNLNLQNLNSFEEAIFIGGDYNVAPEDIDVFDPKTLRNTVCFHEAEQQKFRALINTGYTDVWRLKNNEKQQFSWWDYRSNSWVHNKGLRIDFILANAIAADICAEPTNQSYIYDKIRDAEKTSDHAPVFVEV
jgi:exodeoxyribonuclease III